MQNLIHVLKLNITIIPQFCFFFVTYLILSRLVLRPYFEAFKKRQEATVGSHEHTENLLSETLEIQGRYETRARDLNSRIKHVFDLAKKEAGHAQGQVVQGAREESDKLVKRNRENIRLAINKAREDLKKEVPELSKAISDRLLGKETH